MRRNRNKYKVSPKDQRTHNGRVFASKAEMEYAKILQLELAAEKWVALMYQPPIRLGPIDYVPDFAVSDGNDWRWIDVKGMETPAFRIKKKLWAEYGPGLLVLVKKSGKHFKIVEEIPGKKPF